MCSSVSRTALLVRPRPQDGDDGGDRRRRLGRGRAQRPLHRCTDRRAAAGAAYIILAIEHPPAFIAGSAVGSAAANAAVAIFALVYAVLAQRHGIVLSIGVATLIWFGAAALRLVEWTPAGAFALNVGVFAVTVPASAGYRLPAPPRGSIR